MRTILWLGITAESADIKTDTTYGASTDEGMELQVTLRNSQARFLSDLTTAIDLDASAICRQLIGNALAGNTIEQDSELTAPAAIACARAFAPQRGDMGWTQITIHITPEQFNYLCARAAKTKASASTAMRNLLSRYMERRGIAPVADSSSRRTLRQRLAQTLSPTGAAIFGTAAFALVASLTYAVLSGDATDVAGPHWGGQDASLILDHHTHSNYADGSLTPAALVELAVEHGCDALVISDNSGNDGAVSDQQLAELLALRDQYPDLLLFNGLELNIPSYGGREHAGLIASPHVDAKVLQNLRNLTERSVRGAEKTGAHATYDAQVLAEIENYQSLHPGLLLVYNHPSRNDESDTENVTDILRWNASSPVFVALEGGPGHQKMNEAKNEDHWDPAVATIGGAWDQLLSGGEQIWGALASSEYHNDSIDYPPCAFARTHLIVPEQSHRGVLMALEAGTFWADHGGILNQLQLAVHVEGLEKAAYPGYEVTLGDSQAQASVQLSLVRAPGSYGQHLSAELIGNCRSGEVELLAVADLPPDQASATLPLELAATGADGQSCILRSRIRLSGTGDSDLLAYTNPIRFVFR